MTAARLPVALLALVASFAVLAACSDDDQAGPPGDREQQDEQQEEQGVTGPPIEELDGEELFVQICAACHQQGGTGIEGVFPALAGNAFVSVDDAAVVAETVIHGRAGMPAFGTALSDTEIAALLTYLRTELNDADAVDPEVVAAARDREALDEEPRDEDEGDIGEEDEGE